METLGTNHAQAAVSVAQHQDSIGFCFHHHFVALIYDVSHRSSEVVANSFHVNIGICQFQIFEKDTVEVVVVVLTRMSQERVEIRTTLIDDCGQSDDFRACADDDQQFEFSVVCEMFHCNSLI